MSYVKGWPQALTPNPESLDNTDHSAPFSGQILIHVFGIPRSGVLGILVLEFHLQSKISPIVNPVESVFRTTLQKTTNCGLKFFLSH